MIISYLKYRIKAQGKYHLHSPLVFSLYEKVLEPATSFRAKRNEVKCSREILHERKQHINDDSFYDNLDDKLTDFINDNPFFYMIPIKTIKETIVGFIVRGVTRSDYNTVSREFKDFEKQVPLMYGFDKAFGKLDSYSKSYPIVVCEGCKDCLMLKRFYPYVLANNTSSMGLNATILRNISDKFILAYDNDKAGQEGIERDKKILVETGAFVQVLKLDEGFKDCADYMKDHEKLKSLSKQLKIKLKRLNELSL